MKKLLLAAAFMVGIVYFLSCNKSSTTGFYSCTPEPVTADTAAMNAFVKADSLTITKDSSGIYYQIVDTGNGASPLLTSKVYVSYVGRLMTGYIFDSTTNVANTGFVLNQLIQGWQVGLPKIKAGGRIKLLIPSALAYGCQGSGTTVPPNSAIFFDITLAYIQ